MPSVLFSFITRLNSRFLLSAIALLLFGQPLYAQNERERLNINAGWKFFRYTSQPDHLFYDERPVVKMHQDDIDADSRPTEAVMMHSSEKVLKKWVLPSANPFIKDPAKRHIRPEGHPGNDFPFVQPDFKDQAWEDVTLPHDWAIKGPFYTEPDALIGGGMGRLPVHGVAWYRKKLDIPSTDGGRQIYLDIDGAMSYTIVWLNGHLVGGWPYGYNSFRLDLTPYIQPGGENQLAIRVDNPPHSSRWYPGGGIYRNVWLTKTAPVHVSQWGTFIRSREVSAGSAILDLTVSVENTSSSEQNIQVVTEVYEEESGRKVAEFPPAAFPLGGNEIRAHEFSTRVNNPLLWGPPPTQKPHLYTAVTRVYADGKLTDRYSTLFGIRALNFDPVKGMTVNGEALRIQGVNQHHDLGALGAAFNVRAAERQLEMLAEMGCNAIRMAHNPPAPELLELTDRMGFLVVDEIYDNWETKKTPLDFHLIFPDWQEADLRSFLRRDRNHPSVIAWSYGNEVGEQYTEEAGAALSEKLKAIVREEDPTRPATASMNFAKPHMPFAEVSDILSLNYQGEGIRNAPEYAHLKGINTAPLYPAFHEKYPDKLIFSSETAAALSSRGTYLFPVTSGQSAPAENGKGADDETHYVSAYEFYTAPFGSSAEKVFASQDQHPYVAGEFVWSGWDYLGEPTPYYSSRSSYFGIIDLAGFKKDRYYLYQSRWKPDLPMAHILPHWNWPDRLGQITPVHVFTSGDEAELFLNGRSLGKKKKENFQYRLRWDEVKYEPGELKVVAYKSGKKWAENTVRTTGEAVALSISADRRAIHADGEDLSFITVEIVDKDGLFVPDANPRISFQAEGPAEIVATDNGDPTDMVSFASKDRQAFSGKALVIVRSVKGKAGIVKITATSPGLKSASIEIKTE